MGKLRVLSGAEICQILEQYGFSRIRQRGSHVIMQKRIGADTCTVPVPAHRQVQVGTLSSIIRQSGLARSIFEEPG